ncbi:MAG: hypothetical protein M3O41_19680 [Pseudomonadota bacterium]|nr:hypothetical protein [Pseudomonadota bacterium]
MGRRLLLVVAGLVSIALLLKRSASKASREADLHEAEAQWANEGGANSPASL